jgi:hypothetical protein
MRDVLMNGNSKVWFCDGSVVGPYVRGFDRELRPSRMLHYTILFWIMGFFWACVGLGAQGTTDLKAKTIECRSRTYMLEDFDSGKIAIVAPNGANSILLANDGSFRVLRAGTMIGVVRLLDLSADIKVTWSPDSQKFAITFSDGGAEGAFHAHLYELQTNAINELRKPVEVAFNDFRTSYYCPARGNNIYFEGWAQDSNEVLIVTEVFPTSDCGRIAGKQAGYLMDLHGNVVERFTDKQVQAIDTACDKSGRAHLPPD